MFELEDKAPADDERAAIARYESMSREEIDAELERCGIDPAPTVAAVNALVAAKLAELKAAAAVRATKKRR